MKGKMYSNTLFQDSNYMKDYNSVTTYVPKLNCSSLPDIKVSKPVTKALNSNLSTAHQSQILQLKHNPNHMSKPSFLSFACLSSQPSSASLLKESNTEDNDIKSGFEHINLIKVNKFKSRDNKYDAEFNWRIHLTKRKTHKSMDDYENIYIHSTRFGTLSDRKKYECKMNSNSINAELGILKIKDKAIKRINQVVSAIENEKNRRSSLVMKLESKREKKRLDNSKDLRGSKVGSMRSVNGVENNSSNCENESSITSSNLRGPKLMMMKAKMNQYKSMNHVRKMNLEDILKETIAKKLSTTIVQEVSANTSALRDDDFENMVQVTSQSDSICSSDSEIEKRKLKLKDSVKRKNIGKKRDMFEFDKAIKLNNLNMLKFGINEEKVATAVGKKIVKEKLKENTSYAYLKHNEEYKIKDDYLIRKPLYQMSNENYHMFKSKFNSIIPKLKAFSLIDHKEVLQRFNISQDQMMLKVLSKHKELMNHN